VRLLLIGSFDDAKFTGAFERLPALRGHKVMTLPGGNSVTDVAKVAALCQRQSIDAVICSQEPFLLAALNSTIDWVAPVGNVKISLDDYAGSIIHAYRGALPVLVVRPLRQLMTVPYGEFTTNRYLSKLTQPEKWLKQSPFKWKRVEPADYEAVYARLAEAAIIGEDIETIKDPWRSIECVSFTGVYFDGDTDNFTTESFGLMLETEEAYQFFKRINALPVRKLFQNGLYDNAYLTRWGVPATAWLDDSMHLFHSWLAELPKRLDFITAFAVRDVRYWKHESDHDKLRYCCMDSWATVHAYFGLLMEAPAWVLNNYREEFPMVFPCLHAAMEGIPCDVALLTENCAKFTARNEALLARIQKILGWPTFNPNSPKQMLELFKLLGDSAANSTDANAAKKLAAKHPFNEFILSLTTEYKETTKLIGTYLDAEKIWNGTLFYSINPGKTDTGRCASEASAFWYGFQIQNVPGGPDVKATLHAPAGWFLGEADKAQSEARCVAYLSGDKSLIDLVESSRDYHSWNASAFFGIPYEEIFEEATKTTLNKPIRDLSKRTNHGANYNMTAPVMLDTMGPKAVAQAKWMLKLPAAWSLLSVCKYLLAQYAATYPGVKDDWYSWIIRTVKATHQLCSAFGVVRVCFGDIEQKRTLNALVAHGPQNLSVAIVNRDWYRIWHATLYGELVGKVRIKAQIHDSILFIYREMQDAVRVKDMMSTKVVVTDCHGVNRTMFIPSDLSTGKKQPTRVWSELK